MEIQCPKCGETCAIDFEIEVGQHVVCPYCNATFSYGVQQEGIHRTIRAICPYCGFGESIEEQYAGYVGECSRCHREYTIKANTKGIPIGTQNSISVLQSKDQVEPSCSVFSEIEPKLLVKLLNGVGMLLAGLCIVVERIELLFLGIFLMTVAAVAPKIGATSDLKHLIRYLLTCVTLAIAVSGGCYALDQNQIQKDKQALAEKRANVDARVQTLARKYFGHELCEWCAKDSVNSKPVVQGLNPFLGLKGESKVKKHILSSDLTGCLFNLRADLHQKPMLPELITDEFLGTKISQFKELPLIAEITKILGKAPRFVMHPPFTGEIVNLNAEFNSNEKTDSGEPLVSVKVHYSLCGGRPVTSQGRVYNVADYGDHESWDFEIQYNGH